MFILFETSEDGDEHIFCVAPTQKDVDQFMFEHQQYHEQWFKEFQSLCDHAESSISSYYEHLLKQYPPQGLACSNIDKRMELIVERESRLREIEEEYFASLSNPTQRMVLMYNIRYPEYRPIAFYSQYKLHENLSLT